MQPEHDPNNLWQPNAEGFSAVAPPPEATNAAAPVEAEDEEPITWQASEAVHNEKNFIWFVVVTLVTVILSLVNIFFIKIWTFGALILVAAAALIVVARRPPHVVDYSLSLHELHIDGKPFSLQGFKAFSVVQDNAFYALRLIPHQRFMPTVSVYLPPDLAEEIVDIFGSFLPMQPYEPSPLDAFLERIHFKL